MTRKNILVSKIYLLNILMNQFVCAGRSVAKDGMSTLETRGFSNSYPTLDNAGNVGSSYTGSRGKVLYVLILVSCQI